MDDLEVAKIITNGIFIEAEKKNISIPGSCFDKQYHEILKALTTVRNDERKRAEPLVKALKRIKSSSHLYWNVCDKAIKDWEKSA